jgi:hypothetical protein
MENARLRRYPHPSSLQRTRLYASFLRISDALHLCVFHQPPTMGFSDRLLSLVLHIEVKLYNVSVLDSVILPFESHQPFLFGLLVSSRNHQIIVAHNLGSNEPPLHI